MTLHVVSNQPPASTDVTLLDHFAAAALSALLIRNRHALATGNMAGTCSEAYRIARAMLEARQQPANVAAAKGASHE